MSTRSARLYEQAKRFLPGGVSRNTLLRAPHPFYAASGKGCLLTDVDGVQRIDFANNMASLIHGHAHPAIVAAVAAQLQRGTAYTMATEVEIEHAEHLVGRSPNFAKIRFMNSGTEAVMAALKAARAFTGRPRIAKVEGSYHGTYDYAEVSQAPTPASWGEADHPVSVPLARGTPRGVLDDVVILPFDRPEAALALLDAHRDEVAAVLIDPMAHRIGMVPASKVFVGALGRWAKANGALLIFDEVITFRTEVGGMQARHDVAPDLTAMGKIIGGGFPAGAVAGREEVMAVFASGPQGLRLPHSGTFSANPITMTAGLTAMRLYDAAAVARINALGRLARARIAEAIARVGAPACVTGAGSMFRIHMKAAPPTDYRSAFPDPAEKKALDQFVDGMFDNGIVLVGTAAGMLSTVMGEAEIDRLAAAVETSLRRVIWR
jgi:glutamate-1-semialdehyde 2,1-aminomutase